MPYRGTIVSGFILALIVLSGVYVRIDGLADLGLGFDETIHIYAAKGIVATGEPILPSGQRYGRALPFTYSVALSFTLFGVNEFSARLPSVVFGVLSIILVFMIGRQFFGTPAGLIGAFLISFLPFEIVWSRASRMYSMYQLFFLITFFAFYKSIEGMARIDTGNGTRTNSLGQPWKRFGRGSVTFVWLSVTLLAFYISFTLHGQILMFYGVAVAYLGVLSVVTTVSPRTDPAIRRKYCFLLGVLLSAGLVSVMIPGVREMMWNLYNFAPPWSYHMPWRPAYYVYLMMKPSLFPILIFSVLGAIQACTRFDKEACYTLLAAGIPLIVHSLFVRVQVPRYIYDIVPLFVLLSAYSMSNFWKDEVSSFSVGLGDAAVGGWRNRALRAGLVTVCVLAFALVFYRGLRDAGEIRELQAAEFGGEYNADWRTACAYLNERLNGGDVVVASIPLSAEWSGCKRIDYSLDNGEIDQFLTSGGGQFQKHIFANTRAIVNLEEFLEVVSGSRRGWLVMDAQRFWSPGHTPVDVRRFIEERFARHSIGGDESILVFEWDSELVR